MICLKNMKNEPCRYGVRCWYRHIDNETEDIKEQNKKQSEFKENQRNFHSSGDRDWQNSNSFKERNRQDYHHYDNYQHTSQQYNGRYNQQYEYDYSDNKYINKNQLNFLERYPNQKEICRKIGMAMGNMMEEMTETMYSRIMAQRW